MTPAERAEALFSVVSLADGWAVLGPEGTYIDDAFATREDAEREIPTYAAPIAEAIAAAERDAYNRGVADGVAGLRDKLVDMLEPLATKLDAGDVAGHLTAGALRAVAECVRTAKVEP